MGNLRDSVNGDNTTGHVTMASAAGGAIAVLVSWVLNMNGIQTPAEVIAAMTVIFGIVCSIGGQKLAG